MRAWNPPCKKAPVEQWLGPQNPEHGVVVSYSLSGRRSLCMHGKHKYTEPRQTVDTVSASAHRTRALHRPRDNRRSRGYKRSERGAACKLAVVLLRADKSPMPRRRRKQTEEIISVPEQCIQCADVLQSFNGFRIPAALLSALDLRTFGLTFTPCMHAVPPRRKKP